MPIHDRTVTVDTESKEEPVLVKRGPQTMQDIHYVVRTITKNSSYGSGGEIPLSDLEQQLRVQWLSQGYRIQSSSVIGWNESAFEVIILLTRDVVL